MTYLLLAIDDTEATRHMVEYVVAIAPQLNDCKVRMVAVVADIPNNSQQLAALLGHNEPPELHGDEDQHKELLIAQDYLQDYKKMLIDAGLEPNMVTTRILAERLGVATDLHAEAVEQGCDTIVVGRRSSSLSHFFGSVSSELVKKAHPMTVWVVG